MEELVGDGVCEVDGVFLLFACGRGCDYGREVWSEGTQQVVYVCQAKGRRKMELYC